MRIALAHDWLDVVRGGEAFLERVARLVEERHEAAGLFVMFDAGLPVAPAVDRIRAGTGVTASPLNRIPGATRARRWMLPLFPWAVGRLGRALEREHRRRPIDLVISTSSAAIKGLRTPDGVPHLCCCFAPARYVWSRFDEYASGGGLRGAGLRMFAGRFRAWDRATAANVTRFVAISRHIEAEIRRCYGRDSAIVFPPTRTGYYTPDPGAKREDFWLVVSALEPYKRVDLAVGAANLARHRLIVAGDGTQRRKLERAAGPTVEFVGRVSDERLRELYRTAGIFLFPQIEDYGIVAVEAQACGLPVAAFRAGGALDTVVDGVTGALFDEPTPESLVAAIARIPEGCGRACRENAERFGEAAFDRAMGDQIEAALGARRG